MRRSAGQDYARIDGHDLTILFAAPEGGAPSIIYLGSTLPVDLDVGALAAASASFVHESQADVPVAATLLPQAGTGFVGTPALSLRRGEKALVPDFALSATTASGNAISFIFADAREDLSLVLRWRIGAGDVVRSEVEISNGGQDPIAVDRIASLALPVPGWAADATTFSGRWANEMQPRAQPLGRRTVEQSRRGRPGHGGPGWVVLSEAGAGANHGCILGAHVAWSGDVETIVETDDDRRTQVQLGCRLDSGEIMLAPGNVYTTPEAMFAFATDGRNGLRRKFHSFVRGDVAPGGAGPRKFHFNSWDALGFDVGAAQLHEVAKAAAAIGVERFVLDDGWFNGRRDDRTSLGDWTADPRLYPDGLNGVISEIEALGMDFGLWVEPEMVSPDSDLYREHPDWCIHLPGRDRPTQRSQLVLDLTQEVVSSHVFGLLDALLRDHRIAYLKWDHNRDLFPAETAQGPIGHAQTVALYALIERLRTAHPAVEIEACASGGGRIDFRMLQYCTRVWPSDNNDPFERVRINQAWMQFLPPEMVGSHIGPAQSPQTGRHSSFDFRAKVAVFGHMGIEADPRLLDAEQRKTLKQVLSVRDRFREALDEGLLEEIQFEDEAIFGSLIRHERGSLAMVAQTGFAARFASEPVRLPGFATDRDFVVRLAEPWPELGAGYLRDPDAWRTGLRLPGAVLARSGLALPLVHPGTAWLITIEDA
jgi:alpha-galactosidase